MLIPRSFCLLAIVYYPGKYQEHTPSAVLVIAFSSPQGCSVFFFFVLRNGCICRGLRLAPFRRNAAAAPPPLPLSFHAQSPVDCVLNPNNSLTPSSTTSNIQQSVDIHDKAAVASSVDSDPVPPSPPPPVPSTSQSPTGNHEPGKTTHATKSSGLHPRVAVILGVDRRWYLPLIICRAMSTVPAAWWGLRCAFTFLAELLHIQSGMGREAWAAAIVGSVGQDWDVERRFRVTEVALAIMWVCIGAPWNWARHVC